METLGLCIRYPLCVCDLVQGFVAFSVSFVNNLLPNTQSETIRQVAFTAVCLIRKVRHHRCAGTYFYMSPFSWFYF